MASCVKLFALTATTWNTPSALPPPASDLVIELYDRERAALERYLRLLGMHDSDAADIVHDAFLKLHEHLAAAGDRTNLRAWLYRVRSEERRVGKEGS